MATRPSPAYFAPFVDFTTNHSWWENDALLWDSLVAKQPGLPLLIQETGVQRELTLDDGARRSLESEAALVERKLALSFAAGGGALQWLWHTNSFMTSGNETAIGAVRADGTEKPEAAVVRGFARFAHALGPHLRGPVPPPVAIVTSQAAQFSVLRDLQIEAQRTATRALVEGARQMGAIVAENQLGKLGQPRLVILPSAQALTDEGWGALLGYVKAGGALLVTGPIERDQYWHPARRLRELAADAEIVPVTYRQTTLRLSERTLPVSFSAAKQAALEAARFADGAASLRELTVGRGRLFWAAPPVELAESADAAAALYIHVLQRLGVASPLEVRAAPAGVLIHATVLADAVLYVITSQRDDAAEVDFVDRLTKARIALRLPAQRAALVLLGRKDGAVIARYGF
jgi:hypothetical protein